MGRGFSVMRVSAKYRHHAVMCLSLAAQISDREAKASLLFMAGAWHNLADRADRNSTVDLVYDKTPPQPSHSSALRRN
jgi:hypothetical protein